MLVPKRWLGCNSEQSGQIFDEETLKDTLFVFIDGTIVRRNDSRSRSVSRLLWNDKHKAKCWSFFISVYGNGRINFVSRTDAGTLHDATALRRSGFLHRFSKFCDKFRGIRRHIQVGKKRFKVGIGADKGYRGIQAPPGIRFVVTKTGAKQADEHGSGKPNAKNEFNPAVARFRSVVERTIGAMKQFKILRTYSHLRRLSRSRRIVRVVANLTNVSKGFW